MRAASFILPVMSVNLLAISVGNTRTQVGAFIDDKLAGMQHVGNDALETLPAILQELWPGVERGGDAAVYLASVNPRVSERVGEIVIETLRVPVVRIESDVPVAIGRQLDREAIVGEDRLLCAAGAFDRAKVACAVIDAGTAVTVDFVDGAGTFHGGAILPGAQLMLDALHDRTAQLPEVKFDKPDDTIGHNTVQAMRTGAFHGVRGAVRELVEKYAETYQAYPKVIATGGDAETLFKDYDLVEAIVPELLLLGIAATHRHLLESSE
ncbi:MAG: type III pantothenate kinase [Phycisphaera sp.]|nr:type III pantothenate kinase [Phycisphaera sp.]